MAEPTSTTLTPPVPRYSMDAESFPASEPKYAETVLFVPFYGGQITQIHRHIDLVNDLGFNAVAYNQPMGYHLMQQFMSARQGIGFKHVWADQVEALLNQIQGRKIVFAMSNPASGAIEAIARRRAIDVTGMVCEGGPTAKFFESAVKYLTTEEPVPTKALRYAMATVSTTLWSPNFRRTLHEDLERFPKGFPILSIRGWKDHLIPPHHIDMVFEPHAQLAWQKLSLPEADHLTGLRDFKEEYVPAVQRFLEEIATPI